MMGLQSRGSAPDHSQLPGPGRDFNWRVRKAWLLGLDVVGLKMELLRQANLCVGWRGRGLADQGRSVQVAADHFVRVKGGDHELQHGRYFTIAVSPCTSVEDVG